jgi:hypothetical protein
LPSQPPKERWSKGEIGDRRWSKGQWSTLTRAQHRTPRFCVLIGLLIANGVLDQAEVVARYEALSNEFMTIENGEQMVALAHQIADFAAGRSDRKPS